MSRLSTVTVVLDVKRRSLTLFPVLPKPEVIRAAKRWQIGPVEYKVEFCEFVYTVSAVCTSGLARNGCRWPIFACRAPITLRSRQQTGAECYGTSGDDRNTTSGSMGSDYLTSQVTGSTLPLSGGFRIVNCEFRGQYLQFPSNRKWLPLDRK